MFFGEQRSERMNRQLKRHANEVRQRANTGFKALWLAAALLISLSQVAAARAQVATRTEISAATEQNGPGTQADFSVQVTDATGKPVTAGTVSFFSGHASLGSAVVDANGTAKLTVGKLPQTTRNVSAVYQDGGAQYAASTSPAVEVKPNATGVPDFGLTANVASQTVSAGQYATYLITVTPENGFSETITLSCSGQPASTVCNFTPVTLPTANGAASSTLQVQTQAASGKAASLVAPISAAPRGFDHNLHLAYGLLIPGILALVGVGSLRKRSFGGVKMLGLIALLAASCIGLSACNVRYNYEHHPPSGNPGTGAGSYPFSITAYGNNGTAVTSHTINLTLVVK